MPALVVVDLSVAGVACLTLNDPARRNAISAEMRDELLAAFDDLEQRDDVSAVVITGAGTAFCAGAVLGDLATADSASFRFIYDAFLRVAASPLLTLAAVNGPAVGAGLNLALSCDLRICARSARFVSGFIRIGLHPGGGNLWMLRRAVGEQLAVAMTLLGEELDGPGAARCGLALRCLEDDALVGEAVELARRAGEVPAPLVTRVMQTVARLDGVTSLEDAVELELEAQSWSAKQDFFKERLRPRRAPAS